MCEIPRVLSIQSHVVSGYVGNRSAVFPLQLLGFDVDVINSVQFCNHTGYKNVAGQVLNENDLNELVEGLKNNGLDRYDYLITGYVGSPTFLRRIIKLVQHLREVNPNITYVCDPVMGDIIDGKNVLYVPKELIPIYKEVASIVNIMTPNQYELEILTDTKINSLEDAWKSIGKLHDMGCETVVMTSSHIGNCGCLTLAASINDGLLNRKVVIEIPKIKMHFTGSGDLFAACFLAWMHKTGRDIKVSLEKTIATVQTILKRTFDAAKGSTNLRDQELRLIQSKGDIENPNVTITARIIH